MTLARLSDESIARFGEDEALAFEGRRLTNVRIVPSLPKSPIGKILRKNLRRQAHTPS